MINKLSLPTKFLFQLLNPSSTIAHITAKRSTSLLAKARGYLVTLQKAKFAHELIMQTKQALLSKKGNHNRSSNRIYDKGERKFLLSSSYSNSLK